MLSAGFDADVVHRVARWRERGGAPRRVGRASYLRPIGAALWTYAHAPLSVTADDVTAHGAFCVIGNLPDYALALRPTPAARADDGLLDWTTFQRRGRAALAAYAWAVLLRRHVTLTHVRSGRARRLRVTSEAPVPVQLDGEAAGFTPVEIDVLPAALSLVVV
jgi:diacylglycerol kinase family enzyme